MFKLLNTIQNSLRLHRCSFSTIGQTYREVTIPVPWGHVAGKWWGDTNVQPIVGLHGWEDNASTFDTLAPMLTVPSFLAIDFMGHGMSSYYPLGLTHYFNAAVILIRRVVQHYKWKNVSFIGHSFGSAAAYLYCAIFPNEVEKLVGIECARSLMMPHDDFVEGIHDTLVGTLSIEKKLGTNPPRYDYDELVDRVFNGSWSSPTREACEIMLRRGMKKSPQDDSKFHLSRDPRVKLRWLGRMEEEFVMGCAPRIKCKVLSIRGKEGFLNAGRREQVFLDSLHLLKDVEHHDVEGTHHLHLNNPENVAPIINNFFAK